MRNSLNEYVAQILHIQGLLLPLLKLIKKIEKGSMTINQKLVASVRNCCKSFYICNSYKTLNIFVTLL